MDKKYVAPQIDLDAFNCPYCGVYAKMNYYDNCCFIQNYHYENNLGIKLSASICSHCDKAIVWQDQEMLIPSNSSVPMPNDDMPENVKELYNEAREISNKSARGAAALLRLALDKLCDEICDDCKQPKYNGKISDKIGILVTNGLSTKLQRAFDFVRVTGNDAVHELGLIDIQDNPEITNTLFSLLNLIVEKMITENKQIDDLYNLIPESRRDKIEERDSKARKS